MSGTTKTGLARAALAAMLTSVSAGAMLWPGSAVAQDAQQAEASVAYNIEAQPLSSALSEFARQSGVSVLYPYEQLRNRRAPALRGRFAPDEALRRLLAGSGLSASVQADGSIRLEDPARPQPIGAELQRANPTGGAELARRGADPITDADVNDNEEEIVVTGTRIRGAHPAGSNLTTITREDIDQTGRSSVQDVLSILPQNFPGSQNDTTQLGSINTGRNLAFGSTVDLRGLGADATLTLLNGRRLAPAGFGNFVDISTIPLAAVERIDVLADGASALYGSDAVAGVVNVILRRDFEGAETTLRYGAATRGDPQETNFSQLFGASWRGGNAMIGYEYRDRTALAAADRAFTATSDLRPWGGSNFSSISTNPGNITRIGVTNVVLAIPEGQDGTSLSEADLLAGVTNQRPLQDGNDLIPGHTTQSVFASLRQSLTPDLDIYADILGSRRETESDRWQNNVTLVVPETNAYRVLNNLFPGQGALRIAYNMGEDLGPTHYQTQTEAYSIAIGGAYDITSDWRLDASVALSRNSDHAEQRNVFGGSALLAPALASGNLNTAFNPFGDGANSPAAALQGLTFDDLLEGEAETVTYGAKADGPLFAIWGGDVRVALGVERREENFQLYQRRTGASTIVNEIIRPASRTTDAVFGEMFIPLIGPDNAIPGVRALDLSMSLRYEDASDFGDSTTPKIGVTWALDENIALRASWGESFKAPQFQQLIGNVVGTLLSATAAQDPFATNGSTGILNIAGTNSTLRPETAENWTAGFDLTPTWAPGFSVHATYYDIDFVDRISDPGNLIAALANPTGYEGVFFRNPTQAQIDAYLAIPNTVLGSMPPDGVEVIWDGRLTNLASLRVRGIDLNAAYNFETAFGDIQLFANASLMLQYTQQGNQASAPIDALDKMFNPVDLRARAGVAWSNEDWGASLSAVYVDDYRDTISTPNRRVESWLTWDTRFTYDMRSEAGHGAQIALSVQNLFDEDPPFANNPIGYGFDSQAASPIGRFVAIEVRQTW